MDWNTEAVHCTDECGQSGPRAVLSTHCHRLRCLSACAGLPRPCRRSLAHLPDELKAMVNGAALLPKFACHPPQHFLASASARDLGPTHKPLAAQGGGRDREGK